MSAPSSELPPLSFLFGYLGCGEASPATSSGRAQLYERHENISPDTSLTTQVGVKPLIRFIFLIGPFPSLALNLKLTLLVFPFCQHHNDHVSLARRIETIFLMINICVTSLIIVTVAATNSMAPLQKILVLGGNGFIGTPIRSTKSHRQPFSSGSAVCRAALTKGMQVTSIR